MGTVQRRPHPQRRVKHVEVVDVVCPHQAQLVSTRTHARKHTPYLTLTYANEWEREREGEWGEREGGGGGEKEKERQTEGHRQTETEGLRGRGQRVGWGSSSRADNVDLKQKGRNRGAFYVRATLSRAASPSQAQCTSAHHDRSG